jgi:hypothetical protein
MRVLTTIAAVWIAGACMPGAAWAQAVPGAASGAAQFARPLSPGDPAIVIDRQARQSSGSVQNIEPGSLVLANGTSQTFRFGDIGRIEVPGDPLLNGALFGVLAGSPYWVVTAAFACEDAGPGCRLATSGIAAGVFAAIGAYVDSRHRGRTVVFGPPRRRRVDDISDLWMSVVSGDRVRLTRTSGTVVDGVLQRVEDGSVSVLVDGQLRAFAGNDIARVARRGDSLKNGTLIGVAVGVLPFLAPCDRAHAADDCLTNSTRALGAAFGALTFGAVGAAIDSLIAGHTTVYDATRRSSRTVRLSPSFGPGQRAIRLSIGF